MTKRSALWDIFVCFFQLGLTSFGGPAAHIGFFRTEFVTRRQWLSEHDYAQLVALCQFLPGPASSQVGMAIGMLRAHYAGALLAWLGFTLPSALLLIAFALGLNHWGDMVPSGLLHGLKIVVVAVVAQAVWGMAQTLCNSRAKFVITLACFAVLLAWSSVWSQLVVIGAGALAGWLWLQPASTALPVSALALQVSKRAALGWGLGFALLLLLLPLSVSWTANPTLTLLDSFFRAGSLVFGGGHVVMPLLQADLVPTGFISADRFIAGYGAAQAVPGPLFTFAGFLGASMQQGPTGIYGGILALLAIFLPAFMLLAAALPFWQTLRTSPSGQTIMAGVGASVVAILAAALYQPIWTSAVVNWLDFAAVLLATTALMYFQLRPWLLVLLGACTGALLF